MTTANSPQTQPPELKPCPWCPTTRRELFNTEGGTVGVIIHDSVCFLAGSERRQVLTPKGVAAWNARPDEAAALKELQFMFPESPTHQIIIARGNKAPGLTQYTAAAGSLAIWHGATLEECMNQVRAWAKSRAEADATPQ